MPATEMVHVRIEKRIKTQAAKTLASMGLSVSDAVRVLLTRVAAEKALPFELKVPNAKTASAMQEARKGGLPSFTSVADLMADLAAKDVRRGFRPIAETLEISAYPKR
jgi:DNA-damage-inducible protein J